MNERVWWHFYENFVYIQFNVIHREREIHEETFKTPPSHAHEYSSEIFVA